MCASISVLLVSFWSQSEDRPMYMKKVKVRKVSAEVGNLSTSRLGSVDVQIRYKESKKISGLCLVLVRKRNR